VASYRLEIRRSAEKAAEGLPLKIRRRVVARIQSLAQDPRPFGCEKISGAEKYRLRQGDYRIVYGIDDVRSVVTVIKIGHRRDVYR
jgi:mRNA interferase RelE/StbE